MKTAAAAGAFAAAGCSEAAPETPPNIVLIMADDMGFSDIGCYGGEVETPVIDALAEEGLRFRQFYNTARCCPTRASLMTGLYPPFRLYKHWVHEGGISTPLIAHWPKGLQTPGEWTDEPSHLINIMATCVDVAGVTYPADRVGVVEWRSWDTV